MCSIATTHEINFALARITMTDKKFHLVALIKWFIFPLSSDHSLRAAEKCSELTVVDCFLENIFPNVSKQEK